MQSNLSILIILIIFTLFSFAFAEPDSSCFANQIGISGTDGGGGVSYQRWINDSYGIRCAGFFSSRKTIFREEVTGQDLTWSHEFGLKVIRKIKKWKYVTGTSYVSLDYISEGSSDDERVTIDSVTYPYQYSKTIIDELTLGNGVGLDFKLWRFSLSIMVGVRIGYSFAEVEVITPSPSLGLGIFYCF
jgi:hypothetical protein